MVKKKPMSKEERLKSKRECERRRREKIKQDEEKTKALKIKKHEIYLKAKEEGRVKCVADMNDREKRQKRKQWKKNTQKRRELLKKKVKNVAASIENDTHIASNNDVMGGIKKEVSPQSLNNSVSKNESSQKKRGRKIVKKDRAAAYRKVKKLEAEIQVLKRNYDKYKKRYQRVLLKHTRKRVELTPNSKVKNILKQSKVKDPTIRKRLLFAEVMENELKNTFKSLKTQKEKQIFTKLIGGKQITKYRLQKEAKGFLPTKLILSNSKRLNRFSYERLPRKSKECIRAVIDEFWNSEEFTTICPGKKDFVKNNGLKKQKCYLNDTLRSLHSQFLKRQNVYISYSLFCKLKPFWVLKPNVGYRDTCLCIKHENFRLFTEKLHCLGLIPYKNPSDTIKVLTCTDRTEACLNRSCYKCLNNTVPYSEFDFDKATEVKKWVHKKEERISSKTKTKIIVQMTNKESILCSQGQVVKEYENMQVPMLLHTMNITHQFKAIQSLKENLTDSDLFIHVDFSENFQCKYAQEPQSVHFGASRQQVTLHTGMAYTKNFKEGFSTLSPSLSHNAQAIAAHLRPILQQYFNKFPNITNLHFLSDSPNNQYRNKKMFLIMSRRLPELYPFLKTVSWHYSEAGHGKGAPDGIGGLLKRTADRVVAEGHDIPNFDSMFEILCEKTDSVVLKKVEENDIQAEDQWLIGQDEPKSLKGCMKVHQVTWTKSTNKMMFRSLSCLACKTSDVCKKYHIAEVTCNLNVHNQLNLNELNNRNHDKDINDITVGQWVVIKYDNTLYPGEVCSFNEQGVEVNVMHPANEGLKQFKWPTVLDKHIYQHKDVVKVIDPPKPTSSRAAFFTFNNF